MNTRSIQLVSFAALVCAGVLSGCSRDPSPPSADASAQSTDEGFIARTTRRALDAAHQELVEGNISVGGTGSSGVSINGFRFGTEADGGSGLPKAEISPQGDLLIDGKAVTVDDTQRELLLAHRTNVLAIAEAGMAIGMQGAQLGAEAAKGAITSVLAGKGKAFEAHMQAEAAKIKTEATRLCDRLPPLLASQQALAAALPAFQPYATLDASDVEDCRKDIASGENSDHADADAASQ